MTSQTKTFIELSDILGLQFECRKCGVSLLIVQNAIPAAVDQYTEMLHKCPTCHNPWTVMPTYPKNEAFDSEVKKLIRLIGEVSKMQDRLGCKLRFEIKCEASDRASGKTD